MFKMLITLLNFCFLDPVQDKLTYKIINYTQFTTERLTINHTQGHVPLYANQGLDFEQAFQDILYGRGQLRIDEEVLFIGLNL